MQRSIFRLMSWLPSCFLGWRRRWPRRAGRSARRVGPRLEQLENWWGPTALSLTAGALGAALADNRVEVRATDSERIEVLTSGVEFRVSALEGDGGDLTPAAPSTIIAASGQDVPGGSGVNAPATDPFSPADLSPFGGSGAMTSYPNTGLPINDLGFAGAGGGGGAGWGGAPDGGTANLTAASIASRPGAPGATMATSASAVGRPTSNAGSSSGAGGSGAQPTAPSTPSSVIVQPPGITGMASNVVPSIVGAPLVVLDANTGVTLPTSTPLPSFSTWNMNLMAQAIGKTVTTYAWNLSQAPDATGATGTSTYNLQFQWGSFVSATKTDTVSLTVTYSDTTQQTLTYTFHVSGYNSPAYSAAPTSSSTWPTVLTPDQVTARQETVAAGSYASLGLADGSVQTSHRLPAYNPNVAPLTLDYSSSAADPLPVFLVHYPISSSQAVPPTVSAQLTLNGVPGSTLYYNTATTNPGDILQIALQGQSGLASGRYSWSIAVTANYSGNPVATNYSGNVDLINDSTSAFGAGWSLDNVERLWPVTGGVILEQPGGTSLWFASNGQGGFTTPAGDFSTLAQNGSTYTRTLPDGTRINFNATGLQTSIVDRDGNTTAFGYNGSNQLITITDLNNQVVQIGYTGLLATSFTDPANRTTGLAFTGTQLTAITDADTAVWGYAYNSANELTGITDPNTHTTSFTFSQGQATQITRADSSTESLVAVQGQGLPAAGTGTQSNPAAAVLAALAFAQYTDPDTNVWVNTLDWLGFGESTSAVDPLGDTGLSYRDANGLDWLDTDALGRRTREFFDGKANPTEVVYPDDAKELYSYNSYSEPTQYTNALGGVFTESYNSKGDLTQVQNPLGHASTMTYNAAGLMTSSEDANLHTTQEGYDSLNRLTLVTDATSHTLGYAYDSASNLTSSTDQLGFASTYAYDKMGRLTGETLPDSSSLFSTYTISYDHVGNETAVQDALGNVTQYGYNSVNERTSTTDPLSNKTQYAYDPAGNETQVTDPMGFATALAYDAADQLVSVTNPLNHTTTYAHDAAGETTAVTNALNHTVNYTFTLRGQVATVTDALNNQVQYGYDAAGDPTTLAEAIPQGGAHVVVYATSDNYDLAQELTQVTDAVGNSTTYGYDPVGNLLTVTGPDVTLDPWGNGPQGGSGTGLSYAYDALNRETSITDGAGDKSQYAYDPAGNLTQTTDPVGNTSNATYDAQHRLLTQTSPLGGTVSQAYDLDGRETSLTDPDHNTTSWSYDKDSRLTATTNPMGYASSNRYDADSRLTSTTDADGRQSTFSYDNAGELTGETWLNSSQQAIYTATYSYDNAGQLATESDPSSSYSNTYDAAGHLTQQVVTYPGYSSSALVTLTYSYNNYNDLSGVSDSAGGSVTYGYDGDHRLTSAQLVAGTGNAKAAFTYDGYDRLSGLTRTLGRIGGHQIVSAYGYDNAGRLSSQTDTDNTSLTTLASYSFGYNADSSVTSYTGPEGSLTYGYDKSQELTSASGTVNGQGYSASYSYDVNGNRTMTGYQTGSGNELLNDGTYSYTYDHAGNMQTRIDAAGNVWTYTWDYHNRLTEVVEKNSGGTTLKDEKFTYDVEGRLIGVNLNGVQQRWTVYAGRNPYLDFNASGQVSMRYLTNPLARDDFIARVSASGTVGWYLSDRLGSVRQIVSSSGTILDLLSYDAYGNILSETSPSNGDRFKFAAGEYDSIQVSEHFGARWYGPRPGRWASQDPISFDGGDTNLYGYVAEDPTNATDSSGLTITDGVKSSDRSGIPQSPTNPSVATPPSNTLPSGAQQLPLADDILINFSLEFLADLTGRMSALTKSLFNRYNQYSQFLQQLKRKQTLSKEEQDMIQMIQRELNILGGLINLNNGLEQVALNLFGLISTLKRKKPATSQ